MHRTGEITGALLLTTLGACVGPNRATPQSLEGYKLPAAGAPPSEAPFNPYPETAVSMAVANGCYAVGLTLCRTPHELSALLHLQRPALSEVTHVVASCSAGEVTASFIDETVRNPDPATIRQGSVRGRFKNNSSTEVYASGRFVLTRTPDFEQMTITLGALGIASLTACYSEPRKDSPTSLLSFKVSRGVIGAIFGVPESDTRIHLPIHPVESGMLSFKLETSAASTMIHEATTVLPSGSFDPGAVKAALETALPLALCGVAPWQPVAPEAAEPSEILVQALSRAIRLCERHKLPAVAMLSGAEGPSPGIYEFRCVGISATHAYVLTSIPATEMQTLLGAFQTLQSIDAAHGLYRFDLGEFRARIIRIERC